MTQNQAILAHFRRNKTLTPLEALKLFGCLRLAARVHDLRTEGHNVAVTRWKTHAGKTVALYWLSYADKKAPVKGPFRAT